ncbi:IS6 family transposase [Staphylococcus aureus]|nr:IS6 family transposase [Staphylococcus aureus]
MKLSLDINTDFEVTTLTDLPKLKIVMENLNMKINKSEIARHMDVDRRTVDKYLIEQDHRHIKVRKTRYQSINTAKNTLKGIECIYALYKKNRRSLQIYGFSPCHEISIMLAS